MSGSTAVPEINMDYLEMREQLNALALASGVRLKKESFSHRQNIHHYWVLFVIGVGLVVMGIVTTLSSSLPTPLKVIDAASHGNSFIAERAYIQLKQLSQIGSKITGSYENEILAPDFLIREINFIIQQAKPVHKILYDIQKATGSYYLQLEPFGFLNYYSNVQNIVVRLSSEKSSPAALLINCHYDSVPGSPGASDDGLNCAVMLELLRVLSQTTLPLKHTLIFLFNGAEETPLKASHGFITGHKWAKDVHAFINLEACGAGGREVLFQAGPHHPWLTQLYAESVPYPHGIVLAEEIFQSGLVPSDTDYRVFRDFGKIPGLDFAHYLNGYVYHTKFDNMNAIPMGTLQHTGDNLLALIRRIALSAELNDTDKFCHGRSVYFDILGFYMINYTELQSDIINITTAVLSLIVNLKTMKTIITGLVTVKIWQLVMLGCSVPVFGWLLGIGGTFLTATALDTFNSSLSWYTHSSIIFGLYICPIIMWSMIPYVILRKCNMKLLVHFSPSLQAQIYCMCVQILWTSLLLVATLLRVRSSYVLMMLVLFPSLGSLLLILIRRECVSYSWLAMYLATSTIPLTYILYITVMTFQLFIPICGRIGPMKNPELFIGGLSSLLCILLCSCIIPMIVLVRNAWKTLTELGIFYIISVLAILCTSLCFPYSDDSLAPKPQRILISHTHRVFHDAAGNTQHTNSGFWIIHLDRHNPGTLQSLIPEMKNAVGVAEYCNTELYCGLPLYTIRTLQLSPYTFWIPAQQPTIHNPTYLKLLSKESLVSNVKRFHFNVVGPNQMGIVMSPYSAVKLTNWSFNSAIPPGEPKWQNRPTYFIHYSSGLDAPAWKFSLDFEISSSADETILDIGVIGHYIDGQASPEFKEFIYQYPNWTYIISWTATYELWKF